jgi:integrase
MAELDAANARLKACNHRCTIQLRGRAYSLVATLPTRDGTGRKQQRIPLGPEVDLYEAERKAVELGHQLRTKTFSWEVWDEPEGLATLTVPDFITAAKALHASKYRKDPERGDNAWSKKWAPALRKLPPSGVITEAVLLRVIRTMPAGSASRRDQGNLLSQIAKSLGLNTDPLLEACRGYGVDKLTERDIPSDEAIEAAMACITLPHWRWTFGMCAAYGLRPHECAALSWLEDDWIEVHDKTKTGSRRVTPCPSAWIKRYGLRDLPRPKQSAQTLGKVFNDALDRAKVDIKPYNLRHAYALRLMSKGVAADLAARLMGHSLQVHQTTYQRWIEADRIQKAMAGLSL